VRMNSKAMLLGLSMVVWGAAAPLHGQLLQPSTAAATAPNPLNDPTVKPGKMVLFDLEARFAKDVLEKGGAGFAEWFAEDGVALGNGQPPKVGRVAIAKSAAWSPKGNPVVTSGRYITIWRKQPDGAWKVVLDAGSNEPAEAGDCCKLPVGS